MENMILGLMGAGIIIYITYIFLVCFTITTFVYLTYRFWRMMLPKEKEMNVFITNAPVIGHNYNEEVIKDTNDNSFKRGNI